ncbi:60S ribosomal protein L35a [Galemys pyrenaicus]|uniref:60S ribosomal protein L35a n=1 Tax=Galemys pyrenaicus TaxID=202257 RepID=A0A8J6ADJ7_GALPY|nr:60S ribosomal protein L35a [Galemys pyrenaicus]
MAVVQPLGSGEPEGAHSFPYNEGVHVPDETEFYLDKRCVNSTVTPGGKLSKTRVTWKSNLCPWKCGSRQIPEPLPAKATGHCTGEDLPFPRSQ